MTASRRSGRVNRLTPFAPTLADMDDGTEDDRSLFGYSTGLGPLADFGELGEREGAGARTHSRLASAGSPLEIEIGFEPSGGPEAGDADDLLAEIDAETLAQLRAAGLSDEAAKVEERIARRRRGGGVEPLGEADSF